MTAPSVETRRSWLVAMVALAILTMSYGAPMVAVVALKPIAEEFGVARSAPSLAISLTYFGAGLGGIAMGWLAERVGTRLVALACGATIGIGLAMASFGDLPMLYFASLVPLGLLGTAGMFAPLMTYVTRWFDRRRGSAVALISSGQYVAGAVWPSVFSFGIDSWGWRATMLAYGVAVAAVVVPLAAVFLIAPPEDIAAGSAGGSRPGAEAAMPSWLAMTLLAAAVFCCCVTMSMPQAHLVAMCGDIGIGAAHGAAMLSVLLGSAFVSRQFWGWLSDRVGGLPTILYASAGQAVAMAGFLLTQDEVGLFVVSAVFGLGFGGLIPGYVLAIRDMFPASEAGWRIPVVLFPGSIGMAAGSWIAGALYDSAGGYAPGFAVGVGANLVNLALIGILLARRRPSAPVLVPA